MRHAMRKLAVLLTALVLVLPWASVMAEETAFSGSEAPSNVTVRTELSIDQEAAANLLTMFGLPVEQIKIAEQFISLLDSMSETVVYADNGLQLDLDLNGSAVFSVGGEINEQGLRVASTLFPNYVITASPDTVMEMLQSAVPGSFGVNEEEEDEESVFALGDMDMTAPMEALSGYLNQFISACSLSAVPGQPEAVEFTYKGVTFNTRVPVEIDMEAIVEAEKEMVEQILADEDIRPVLEIIAQYSGGSFDPDDFDEMNEEIMSDEHMPDVTASMYMIADENGNTEESFCMVSESTYKEAENPAFRFTLLSQGNVGDMTLELLEENTTIGFSYGPEETDMNIRMDYTADDMYLGFALDAAIGADIVATCDTFFMDAEKPFSRAVVTVSMNGERTLPTDGEGKKAAVLEDFMSGAQGAANGLLSDIMLYGLGSLITSIKEAAPEAEPLINMMMGITDTTGAAAGADETVYESEDSQEAQGVQEEQETEETQEAQDVQEEQETEATEESQEVQDTQDAQTGEDTKAAQATKTFQLGASGFTVEVPESFLEGEMSDEEIEDDMIAYMFSPDTEMDFDVYFFSKDGYPEELADFAAQEAAEYNASEVITNADINGIPAAWYTAVETYDEEEFNTVTYILDDGDSYVEIAFWLDGDDAWDLTEQIMSSLTFVTR